MSWPEVRHLVTFSVCIDQPENRARVAVLNRSSHASALPVAATESLASASSAETGLMCEGASRKRSAEWHVEIDGETVSVSRLKLRGEWRWDARTAGRPEWCDRLVEAARTALASAKSLTIAARVPLPGKEAARQSEMGLAHRESGSSYADGSMLATRRASDAGFAPHAEWETSTTSEAGKSFLSCDLATLTVCSSVADAIAGFIREQTPDASSFDCALTLVSGWTQHGVDDKGKLYELSDTQRYRLCGNGCGSVVLEWIGRRLMEAEQAG